MDFRSPSQSFQPSLQLRQALGYLLVEGIQIVKGLVNLQSLHYIAPAHQKIPQPLQGAYIPGVHSQGGPERGFGLRRVALIQENPTQDHVARGHLGMPAQSVSQDSPGLGNIPGPPEQFRQRHEPPAFRIVLGPVQLL